MLDQEQELLTPSMEDYLEMIYRNCLLEGHVRMNQLAEQLHVRTSSTTKIVQKLALLDLVDYEKYGIIQLTEKGKKLGEFLLHRHKVIESFLEKIGVHENLLKDTEMIEHQVSIDLLENIEIFNHFLAHRPDIIEDFHLFRQTNGVKEE